MPMTGWVGHLVRLDAIKLVNLGRRSFGLVFGQDPLIESLFVSTNKWVFCAVVVQCKGGEWFHYQCVGLSSETRFKGKWYCLTCRALQRRGLLDPPL
jgi:hypothetical protein